MEFKHLTRILTTTTVFTILVINSCCSALQQNEKLKMSLYYESLCPFCGNFIKKVFYPTWVKIDGGKYIDIEFLPYGNAQTKVLPDGTFNITCQHGQDECAANILHNCALEHIPSVNYQLAFIYCTLKSKIPYKAGADCAKRLREDFTPIRTCVNGKEGPELHYQAGVKTSNLNPPHQGVPWIIFNDTYNYTEMMEARQDFLGFLCKKLELNKPPQCANYI